MTSSYDLPVSAETMARFHEWSQYTPECVLKFINFTLITYNFARKSCAAEITVFKVHREGIIDNTIISADASCLNDVFGHTL